MQADRTGECGGDSPPSSRSVAAKPLVTAASCAVGFDEGGKRADGDTAMHPGPSVNPAIRRQA